MSRLICLASIWKTTYGPGAPSLPRGGSGEAPDGRFFMSIDGLGPVPARSRWGRKLYYSRGEALLSTLAYAPEMGLPPAFPGAGPAGVPDRGPLATVPPRSTIQPGHPGTHSLTVQRSSGSSDILDTKVCAPRAGPEPPNPAQVGRNLAPRARGNLEFW